MRQVSLYLLEKYTVNDSDQFTQSYTTSIINRHLAMNIMFCQPMFISFLLLFCVLINQLLPYQLSNKIPQLNFFHYVIDQRVI